MAQHDNQGTASGAPGERGAGPTREGATGSGIDGVVAGAALVLTLYGLVAILVDVVADQELVSHNALVVAGVMVGCLLVGAVLGGIAASRSDR